MYHHFQPSGDLVRDMMATQRFIVCAACGNKRCPQATDHRLVCTGSNAPNQPGSSYQQRYFGDEPGTPPVGRDEAEGLGVETR
jgi:hypothetical protein